MQKAYLDVWGLLGTFIYYHTLCAIKEGSGVNVLVNLLSIFLQIIYKENESFNETILFYKNLL